MSGRRTWAIGCSTASASGRPDPSTPPVACLPHATTALYSSSSLDTDSRSLCSTVHPSHDQRSGMKILKETRDKVRPPHNMEYTPTRWP